jgi:hypothetical protein
MSNADRQREMQRIAEAILSAAKSHFGEASQVDVHIDPETGEPSTTVNGRSLTKDEIGEMMGRVAARTAKRVIVQKLREIEREFTIRLRDSQGDGMSDAPERRKSSKRLAILVVVAALLGGLAVLANFPNLPDILTPQNQKPMVFEHMPFGATKAHDTSP